MTVVVDWKRARSDGPVRSLPGGGGHGLKGGVATTTIVFYTQNGC